MKKIASVLTKLTLIFAVSCPLTTIAGYGDQYRGDLVILNQTPFTLVIVDNHMTLNKYGEKGKFVFSDQFKAQQFSLMPGDEQYIGYGESDTSEVEGYLTFRLLNTDQSFVAHYRLAEIWTEGDTWIKLEQLGNSEPYSVVSISWIHNCDYRVGFFGGASYHHTCALTFRMDDDEDVACTTDPDCTFFHYYLTSTPVE